MSFRMYQICKFLIVLIMAGPVAWAVTAGIAWIPIPAAAVALFIMFLTRRTVKEVVVDERSYTIASQASRITFQASAIIMAFVGLTLEALSRGDYPNLRPYADTLVFSACGLVLLYLANVLYYTGKYGATEEI